MDLTFADRTASTALIGPSPGGLPVIPCPGARSHQVGRTRTRTAWGCQAVPVDWGARIAVTPPRVGDTRVVAVDGPSGSGKTTLAERIEAGVGSGCQVVHLDDFYPGWDGLAAGVGALVDWILRPLAQGWDAGYRRYDWIRQEYAEWHPLVAAPVLVIEGSGAGSRPCAPFLSLLIWVEAPKPVRYARGISRDGEAFRPHWQRWARQEEELFAAEGTRDRADLIMDGTWAQPGDGYDAAR